MKEGITCILPPGLMKMRLMHHQEHPQGHQAPKIIHVVACHPTMSCCLMNSSMVGGFTVMRPNASFPHSRKVALSLKVTASLTITLF